MLRIFQRLREKKKKKEKSKPVFSQRIKNISNEIERSCIHLSKVIFPPSFCSFDRYSREKERVQFGCVCADYASSARKKNIETSMGCRSSNNQQGNNVARIVERLNRLPFARDFPWKYNLFEDLSALNTTMETKQWKISHVYYALAKRRF